MSEKPVNPNRRKFIKSILGLGSVLETSARANVPVKQEEKFFWADLSTGNIGFPTGLDVPMARPGSVMKVISAAALLEEGAINPNESIECTGYFQHREKGYKCPLAHGMLSVEEALAQSCNVYFAKASCRLGSHTLLGYAEKFGLNTPISDQPSGSFPERESVEDDVVPYALGLSKQVKPSALQLLRVAALVAGGGNVPFLKSAEKFDLKGEAFKLQLSDTTFDSLAEGMRRAARSGTARHLDPEDKLKLAVKTGTVGHGKKFKSWIIGFFPFDNPKHAFSLFAPVGTSHDSAVPLAARRLLSVEWP